MKTKEWIAILALMNIFIGFYITGYDNLSYERINGTGSISAQIVGYMLILLNLVVLFVALFNERYQLKKKG